MMLAMRPMRPPARSGRLLSVGIAGAFAWAALALPLATVAQGPATVPAPAECAAEVEPNDTPDQASSRVGEICLSGTLPEQSPADQDLILWEVLPEDGLTEWSVTMRGVPATITSAHVIPITSPPGVSPLETGAEVFRADSDAHLGTPPVTTETRLAPGRYIVGISRGLPGFSQALTDDVSYEMRLVRTGELPPAGDIEPNDDATTATSVTGPFALSGDLQVSNDHYRWTITPEDAAAPLRVEAQAAISAPLTLELFTAAGELLTSAPAGADGVATIHDLSVAPGDYDIALSPGSGQAQPYILVASVVTGAGVDPEPNDTPERAMPLDPVSLTAGGRLTADTDVDLYSLELDAAMAGSRVDLGLSWSDGATRQLCLQTETGTNIACHREAGGASIVGLLLPPARYLLAVTGTAGLEDRYELSVTAGEPLPPPADSEPNDDPTTASPVQSAFAASGDLVASLDHLRWTIGPADAEHLWRLDASTSLGGQLTVDLLDSTGASVASAYAGPEGTAAIHDLRLSAGDYTIALSPAAGTALPWVLRSSTVGDADVDPEPNGSWPLALPLDPSTLTAKGRLATDDDVDIYGLDIDPALAGTLLTVELAWTDGLAHQVCLASKEGTHLQCRDGREGLILSDLLLPIDRYTLEVTGYASLDDRYELRVTRGPAPSTDHEAEPNEQPGTETPWDPSLVMHGGTVGGDIDSYRVHIDGESQLWRLDVTGEGLGPLAWLQPDGTHVGSGRFEEDGSGAALDDLFLVKGDHLLSIQADGDYELRLVSLGPLVPGSEREPNDDLAHSAPLPVGGTRIGRLPSDGDMDVYRFSLAAPEHVLLHLQPPPNGEVAMEVTTGGEGLVGKLFSIEVPAKGTGEPVVYEGALPAGGYEIRLRPATASTAEYSLRLERGDPFVVLPPEVPPAALAADLALTSSASEVAAYILDGQSVAATLTVANGGPADLALTLDAVTSHHAWTVELPEAEVTVAASSTAEIPLVIHVPSDAWRGIPVRVTLRARDPSGAQGTAWVEITPTQDAAPVSPSLAWSVPDALLGGLDVASTALGGVPTSAWYHDLRIHDGLSMAGTGLLESIANGSITYAVDLAGEAAVPVAGIILDPLAGDGSFGARPRAFELLLSSDGVTWTPVLAGELSPLTIDQPFVLDAPIAARFAQLRVDSTWGGTEGAVSLGEWKVVAAPGAVPSPMPTNISDPVRGGHIVWTDPQPQQYDIRESLTEGDDFAIRYHPLEAGQQAQWVVAFRDDRAAQVTELQWVDPTGSDPQSRFTALDVEVSTDSPLGPWQSLGTWQLQRAADGAVAPFTLAAPAWARFIRFSGAGDPEAPSYREFPATLRVLERPTDATYLSILGEWGQSSPRGIYEVLVPAVSPAAGVDTADVGDTPETGSSLAIGAEAAGHVARGKDVDWYTMTIPEGQNTLVVRLETPREGDVRLRLQDAAGQSVDMTVGQTHESGTTTWAAIVEPGATYYLSVEQPVLSVAFTFDTSSSVEPWYPNIRAAIGAFASDVTPGEEAVQVFPFEEAGLLEDWSDQPYLIRGAIDGWMTRAGSSAMEAAVTTASNELAERDGARAILLLTDAIGSFQLHTTAWKRLADVRPAIFPVHIGGGDDPGVTTDLMIDWAAANGGFYQYATSQAAIERAFDRMATWLRRPASYALGYETSFVDYPGGNLSVVPAEGTSVPIGADATLELVLDTSGSMNKRLEGVTRMAMAQAVLTRLVDETLPEGLPVALRTFKAGRGSCDTVLAVPSGPLERAAMSRVIGDLRINRETRTPLGATLHAVGDDLADRPGPKIVVFVTDGKETCKGDPEAEVARLVDLGVDVALNIVGFALEDPALKADMASWAATGGGVFFDAQDQETLLAGIAAALQAPFRVYDRDDVLVGSGVAGGPDVELPPGTYRVEVLSEPLATYDEVVVAPGEGVVIEIPSGPS